MRVYIDECHLSNGLVLHSDSRTPVHDLFKEVYRTQAYTPSDIPPIKNNDVVIDLGANIGVFSLFAASVSPSVRVHAFEPVSETFSLLKKNVSANKLSNVQCHRCAVSSATGEQTLYVTLGSTADTMIPARVKMPGSAARESVECVSLNDLFVRHGITKCNFLKVDVEGSEFDIFLSASPQTLGRIDAIAMEYHEWEERKPDELTEFLRSNGFSVRVHTDRLPGLGMIYASRGTSSS
jgi:FkbM family methyltransferase